MYGGTRFRALFRDVEVAKQLIDFKAVDSAAKTLEFQSDNRKRTTHEI